MRGGGINLKFIGEAANLQNKRTKKLLEVKFGLGKFEITNLEIYKNPPVKFNRRGKFKGAQKLEP